MALLFCLFVYSDTAKYSNISSANAVILGPHYLRRIIRICDACLKKYIFAIPFDGLLISLYLCSMKSIYLKTLSKTKSYFFILIFFPIREAGLYFKTVIWVWNLWTNWWIQSQKQTAFMTPSDCGWPLRSTDTFLSLSCRCQSNSPMSLHRDWKPDLKGLMEVSLASLDI